MKKLICFLLLPAVVFASGISPSANNRGRISPLKATTPTVGYAYEFDPKTGAVSGMTTSLTESFDPDYTVFSSGNSLKAVPVATDFYDLLSPGHELYQEGAAKIHESDDYYSLIDEEIVGGEDGFFYQMYLTRYKCNYYFAEDLGTIELYIPTMNLYELDYYVRHYELDYLKMPYFGIDGNAYLDFTYENGSWTLNTSNGLKIIGQTSNGYYKVSFPFLEKISSFSLFETHNYHSFYDEKESQFAERIGFFLPSESMKGKYVSLPFDVNDIRFEEDCCVTLIADSFTGLIAQNTSSDWTHDYSYEDEKGRGYHDWTFISRGDWLPKASDSNQYLDSIDIEVTNNQSVIDAEGKKTENITVIEKTVNHTNNIGGSSGSLLYQYFPDFTVDDFTAGTIRLKNIHFYFRDISSSHADVSGEKQTYDLSFVRKFKFTYDNRPTVRVAYVDASPFNYYYYTQASIGGLWNTITNFFRDAIGLKRDFDGVQQCYAFSLYFEEERITKIPNVQHVVFSYEIAGKKTVKDVILNEEYLQYTIGSKAFYGVLDSTGFGCITTDQIYNKDYVTSPSGVLHDYAFIYQHLVKEDWIDKVEPLAVYYQENELSTLSQAVTNAEGLHVVGNQVFDKDNNLRLDYTVEEKTYTYEDGTSSTFPEILDSNGNPIDSDTIEEDPTRDNSDDADPSGILQFLKTCWNDLCGFFTKNAEIVRSVALTVLCVLIGIVILGFAIRLLRWVFKDKKNRNRRKRK